ncbi:MAG: hypothetical protein SO072_07725 [Dysosmobacter sp.]|nr:hypothetical protein [Dysosmobacter sp.]
MAKNVFDPEKEYQCRLDGIMFIHHPQGVSVLLPGHLAADTVESDDSVFGKQEFAVFTVKDNPNGAYSPKWVGTYRLSMDRVDSWLPADQMPLSVLKKLRNGQVINADNLIKSFEETSTDEASVSDSSDDETAETATVEEDS